MGTEDTNGNVGSRTAQDSSTSDRQTPKTREREGGGEKLSKRMQRGCAGAECCAGSEGKNAFDQSSGFIRRREPGRLRTWEKKTLYARGGNSARKKNKRIRLNKKSEGLGLAPVFLKRKGKHAGERRPKHRKKMQFGRRSPRDKPAASLDTCLQLNSTGWGEWNLLIGRATLKPSGRRRGKSLTLPELKLKCRRQEGHPKKKQKKSLGLWTPRKNRSPN